MSKEFEPYSLLTYKQVPTLIEIYPNKPIYRSYDLLEA